MDDVTPLLNINIKEWSDQEKDCSDTGLSRSALNNSL